MFCLNQLIGFKNQQLQDFRLNIPIIYQQQLTLSYNYQQNQNKINLMENNIAKEISDPDFYPYMRKSRPQTIKKKLKSLKANIFKANRHTWTPIENIRYSDFLKKNQQRLQLKDQMAKRKIFYKMALAIKSRTARQCKSHHQKMLKSNKNIDGIIKRFEELIQTSEEQRQNQAILDQNNESRATFTSQIKLYPTENELPQNYEQNSQMSSNCIEMEEDGLFDVLDLQY